MHNILSLPSPTYIVVHSPVDDKCSIFYCQQFLKRIVASAHYIYFVILVILSVSIFLYPSQLSHPKINMNQAYVLTSSIMHLSLCKILLNSTNEYDAMLICYVFRIVFSHSMLRCIPYI